MSYISRTVDILEMLEFAKSRTVSHEFSEDVNGRCLAVAFTDGSTLNIESACEMSYGDHPCPCGDRPEITIWEDDQVYDEENDEIRDHR